MAPYTPMRSSRPGEAVALLEKLPYTGAWPLDGLRKA